MRVLPLLLAATIATCLTAQSPLGLPFNTTNGIGGTGGMFFDLDVTEPSGITITGVDVNAYAPSGTLGSVELYTAPTTYLGVQTNAAAWTLGDSGACIAAGINAPAPMCFQNGGVFLAMGSHGICLRHVGIGVRFSNSTGPVTVSTAEVSFAGGQSANMATPFSVAPQANRILNGNLYYHVGNTPGGPCPPFATKSVFGGGCYAKADSWHEEFAQLTAFDLAGAPGSEVVLVATPIGAAGYAVAIGASAWFPPTSTPVLGNTATPTAMDDDTMSGPQMLPFAFLFPGAALPITVMHVCSNGFIHLGPTTLTASDWSPTSLELHTLQPRLCPMWADWHAGANLATDPASGVYYDVDPSGQTVYFTWLDVADRRGQIPTSGATSINFQCAIHQSGVVEYRYQNMIPAATGNGVVMVGFSKGNRNVFGGPTSVDLGSTDLSASVPFASNGPDSLPLTLDCSLPHLNQNWNLTTTNITPVSPLTITFFGTAAVNPGIDLGFLGAAGCSIHINTILMALTSVAAFGSSVLPVPVPSNPTLAGLVLSAQSVCLSTANALGLQSSNGVEVTLGL